MTVAVWLLTALAMILGGLCIVLGVKLHNYKNLAGAFWTGNIQQSEVIKRLQHVVNQLHLHIGLASLQKDIQTFTPPEPKEKSE
jgi:hypothetical protein